MTDLSKPEQRYCAKCGAQFVHANKFLDQRLCASCGLESLRRFLESTDEPDKPFGILYHAMMAVSVYLIGAVIALVFYALTR